MKAISLSQPMAWAIFHGKDVENRTRPNKFRGRVMIQASNKFDAHHLQWLKDNVDLLDEPIPDHFLHGVILGEIDIVDCKYRFGDENDNLYSKWHFRGQYGFILANPAEYKIPIPCKGTIFPLFFEPNILGVKG
jgi:hypothetical protein